MDLSVQTREKFGKAVNGLRKQGLVPAELYGHGIKNLHLVVPAKEFNKVFKAAGANTVVNLVIEKDLSIGQAGLPVGRQGNTPVLIHDVTKDYMTEEVQHIDFYQVRMDEKIKAKIPLVFKGESAAVKEKAAILNKAMAEVEVEALPGDLPRHLEVDLSALDDLNKSVYVKDIVIPRGVKVLVDLETVIVTATPPAAEEEKVEAAPVDVTAVKVETEEKKTERATEKAAKATKEE